MSVVERLRVLDGRVLGRERPVTAETHRTAFLIGIGGMLAVVLAAVLSGWSELLVGSGGFAGVAIRSGVRWVGSGRAERGRAVVVGVGVVAAVAALVAAFATAERWDPDRVVPLPNQVRKAEPTQFVQCDETPRGRGYAYQAPVGAELRCANGAEPRVLLRP